MKPHLIAAASATLLTIATTKVCGRPGHLPGE